MVEGIKAPRVMAALALLAGAASAQDTGADAAVFQKVCGSCHASSMVSDLKTEDEWTDTVANMVSNGAKGTDEQFAAVMRYLARNLTKVNINTADADQIAPVLDVSDTVAAALVEYRTKHGSFASLEDLKKVPGLNAAKLDARKNRIAFR